MLISHLTHRLDVVLAAVRVVVAADVAEDAEGAAVCPAVIMRYAKITSCLIIYGW